MPQKMTKDEVTKRVSSLVVEKLSVDETEVTPEAKFIDDLGADSLDSVSLFMDVEQEFDIRFTDAEMERVVTFRNLDDLIFEVVNR